MAIDLNSGAPSQSTSASRYCATKDYSVTRTVVWFRGHEAGKSRLNAAGLPMAVDDFDHILLQDTFVLGWQQNPSTLEFFVEANLLQTHPLAHPPRATEWACYRRGVIRFVEVTSVTGLLPMSSVRSTTELDGTVDFDCIDALEERRPGHFFVAGEFGTVAVVAADVVLEFQPEVT